MGVFSIGCLVVILFVIQHLLSWVWRKNYKDNEFFVLGMFLTFIGGLGSLGLIYLIILWGKNLV